MAVKPIGLSRELIIHPGETLQDIMENRGMNQNELAARTGVSPKHVSTILSGQKSISVAFAKKLEYVLGVEASFWINLQANYDREIMEFEELNNISAEELAILANLKDVTKFLESERIIEATPNPPSKVLELRKFLNIGNLTCIPSVSYSSSFAGAFRIAQAPSLDAYVLFAWMQLCDYYASRVPVKDELDVKKLKNCLPEIKKLIGKDPDLVLSELRALFACCGIAFNIVKNFKGAPVHGLIKRMPTGQTSLIVTIRGAWADGFWFAVFHEIAHILNGDFRNRQLVDFSGVDSEMESNADRLAGEMLLNKEEYQQFVSIADFSLPAIRRFSETQGVPSFIVIGRLQWEGRVQYNGYYESDKVRYKWAE